MGKKKFVRPEVSSVAERRPRKCWDTKEIYEHLIVEEIENYYFLVQDDLRRLKIAKEDFLAKGNRFISSTSHECFPRHVAKFCLILGNFDDTITKYKNLLKSLEKMSQCR